MAAVLIVQVEQVGLSLFPHQGPTLRLTGRQCDQKLSVGDQKFRTGRQQATNLFSPRHLKFQGKWAFLKENIKLPWTIAAQCERAISAQNRIKSSVRVNLAVSTLEDLIRISAEGPPAAEFDPTPSINKWLARNRDAGERLRRPHFQRSSLKWSRSVELCIPTGIPIDCNMPLLH